MENLEKLQWSALEYEEKERGQDWFWALGVVVAAGSIASILFENYFFAALLVLGGGMLGFFAVKKPGLIKYEINEKGIKIQNELYPFSGLRAFWIELPGKINEKSHPILLVATERIYAPKISIPIEEEMTETIRTIMLNQEVKEEEIREHISEKILERLGF